VALGLTLLATLGAAAPGAARPHASETSVTGTCSPGLTLFAAPDSGASPLTVSFALADPTTSILSVGWAFGDGASVDGPAPTFLSVDHLYAAPGSFLTVAMATTATGTARCTVSITVQPSPLVASIVATPTSGPAPLTVHFTVNLSGGSGTFTSATWSFGDGSSGSGSALNYTYSVPGSFTARFTVVDAAGLRSNATVQITVTGDPGVAGAGTLAISPGWLAVGVGLVAVGASLTALAWRLRRAGRPQTGVPSHLAADPTGPRSALRRTPAGGPPPASTAVGGPAPTSGARLADGAVRDPRLSVRLHERVLLHLWRLPREDPGELPAPDRTQAGIAQASGVGRNQVSSVLNRLIVAGVVSRELSHVRGQPKRLRVYRLTHKGESLALRLHERSRRAPVDRPTDVE
jgi:PKD repeat protein